MSTIRSYAAVARESPKNVRSELLEARSSLVPHMQSADTRLIPNFRCKPVEGGVSGGGEVLGARALGPAHQVRTFPNASSEEAER